MTYNKNILRKLTGHWVLATYTCSEHYPRAVLGKTIKSVEKTLFSKIKNGGRTSARAIKNIFEIEIVKPCPEMVSLAIEADELNLIRNFWATLESSFWTFDQLGVPYPKGIVERNNSTGYAMARGVSKTDFWKKRKGNFLSYAEKHKIITDKNEIEHNISSFTSGRMIDWEKEKKNVMWFSLNQGSGYPGFGACQDLSDVCSSAYFSGQQFEFFFVINEKHSTKKFEDYFKKLENKENERYSKQKQKREEESRAYYMEQINEILEMCSIKEEEEEKKK